jgi:hypothetical protein
MDRRFLIALALACLFVALPVHGGATGAPAADQPRLALSGGR